MYNGERMGWGGRKTKRHGKPKTTSKRQKYQITT
jgi:hypothetical protein